MKMMLKMQKINKAGKVVVNYLSTLHLSPKQFVLEVLLKIPNFWKTSKKKTRWQTRITTSGPPVISQQISAKRVPLFYGLKYLHVKVRSNAEPNHHPRKTISSFVSAENGRTCKRDRLQMY